MSYLIKHQESGYLSVRFRIPPTRVEEIQSEMAQDLNLAPYEGQRLLEQRIMQTEIQAFAQEHQLQLWEEPELKVLRFQPEYGLHFEAEMETLPEIQLPPLDTIRVYYPEMPDPTQEDILEEIAEWQLALAERTEVKRPVAWDDLITVDMIGTVGEHPLPLSARCDYAILVEEGTLFPNFARQLIGAEVGQSCEVKVTLPDDFEHSPWRGEKAIYDVYIKKIETLERPPLDDDFPVMVEKGETIEEMCTLIYDDLYEERLAALDEMVMTLMLGEVARKSHIPIPDNLLEAEIESTWERLEYPQLYQQGLTDELIDASLDSWFQHEGIREQCYWRLTSALLLRAVVLKEGLEVSKEETLDLLATFATEDISPNALLLELKEQNTLPGFVDKLLLNKAAYFLRERLELLETPTNE